MIRNPILKGCNPDPCICRKGDDYYCAVSSFEWFPGIPVYHSRDLRNWELITNVLSDYSQIDLRNLPSGKGIWAPCLTYCEEDGLFYILFGCMYSTNARYHDCANYIITSKNIEGPWSEPVYVHSAGFDASLFHDENGRKYVSSIEWETREGYEKPGEICVCEIDPKSFKPLGFPKRVYRGATERGCLEAPHITKKNGYYYLMCAEGGTGYGHCVTMARSRDIFGDYEPDPENPILTSYPENFVRSEDHVVTDCFNPEVKLQKAGHGSYVDLPDGGTYLVHLCGRPFLPELRCTLGRETAIQQMEWTDDGWLRKVGGKLPDEYVKPPELPEIKLAKIPELDDFDSEELGKHFYSPRIKPTDFADLTARKGYIRLRGGESFCSPHSASILARKLTGVKGAITTKLDFTPEIYKHSAGILLYYNNLNFVYLRKYFSETSNSAALGIVKLERGEKTELVNTRIPVDDREIYLRIILEGKEFHFEYGYDGSNFLTIGESFDLTKLSDDYVGFGSYTGAFAGIGCIDLMFREKTADFDFFDYRVNEEADVN
ncbi:MAG: glycoside hydrolase family 43 protein [Oscillospiraceae bacterium]|nr:glycoside hydrolase family 43 protein [Oscillospiraceae bacterium]